MRAPRRLKDDPSVGDGLRDALLEEEELVDDYDLGALRARVVGGTPTAPPGLPRPLRWLAVIAVSGFTAAVVSLWLQPDAQVPIAPVQTPAIQVHPTVDLQTPSRTVETLDDGTTDAAPAPDLPTADAPASVPQPSAPQVSVPHAAPSEPVEPPAPAVVAGPAADASAETDARPETPPTPAPVAPAGLAAELAAYNRGLDAAERGDWRAARDAYTTYLQTWPNGQMTTEGWLGLLTATVESSSPAAAEALASEMLARGGLGSRRTDVILVRAEALVQLGDCDQALHLVEGFRRNDRVNSIKQSCKRARRLE